MKSEKSVILYLLETQTGQTGSRWTSGLQWRRPRLSGCPPYDEHHKYREEYHMRIFCDDIHYFNRATHVKSPFLKSRKRFFLATVLGPIYWEPTVCAGILPDDRLPLGVRDLWQTRRLPQGT